MIEKQVTIEGVMRYDEEQSNETAMLQDYRAGAGTTGKIEVHVTGFLLKPSLL